MAKKIIRMDSEDKKAAIKMDEMGLARKYIANYYSVTPQYISKLCNPKIKKPAPKPKPWLDQPTPRLKHGKMLKQDNAVRLVKNAIEKGVLHPQSCEICGLNNPPVGRRIIDAHHDDYDEPLRVRWLCKKHHREWHGKNVAKNTMW